MLQTIQINEKKVLKFVNVFFLLQIMFLHVQQNKDKTIID